MKTFRQLRREEILKQLSYLVKHGKLGKNKIQLFSSGGQQFEIDIIDELAPKFLYDTLISKKTGKSVEFIYARKYKNFVFVPIHYTASWGLDGVEVIEIK